MTASLCTRTTALAALMLAMVLAAAAADRPTDRDQATGVTVAPGAQTWTSDNFAEKKQLINDIAVAEGKACSDNYAFLGWPPGSGGGTDVIMLTTRASYEAAGFTVVQKQGHVSTDTIWTVANKDGRQAVILWGAVTGSTIYLACLTGGTPAANPDKMP